MGAGLALGGLAALGYAFDVVPSLPPEVLKLVLYKLVAIGALGLIAFGAILGRLDRRLSERRDDRDELAAATGRLAELPGEPLADAQWSRPEKHTGRRSDAGP